MFVPVESAPRPSGVGTGPRGRSPGAEAHVAACMLRGWRALYQVRGEREPKRPASCLHPTAQPQLQPALPLGEPVPCSRSGCLEGPFAASASPLGMRRSCDLPRALSHEPQQSHTASLSDSLLRLLLGPGTYTGTSGDQQGQVGMWPRSQRKNLARVQTRPTCDHFLDIPLSPAQCPGPNHVWTGKLRRLGQVARSPSNGALSRKEKHLTPQSCDGELKCPS